MENWILYWLLLFFLHPAIGGLMKIIGLRFGLHPLPFVVYVISATLIGAIYFIPPIRTSIFWVLVILLTPTLLLEPSPGNILLAALIISRGAEYIHHLSPLVQSLLAASSCSLNGLHALWCVSEGDEILGFRPWVTWTILLFIFRDSVHHMVLPLYYLLWSVAFAIISSYVIDLSRPWSWVVLATSVDIGLGLLIKPDRSVWRMIAWMASIPLPLLGQGVYASFYIYPERYLPAFKLILKYFTFSSRYYHITEIEEHRDDFCEDCLYFTKKSRLLLGSKIIFTPLVEWHDVRPPTTQDLPDRQCKLCPLIWHGVEKQRGPIHWQVKVWQERPISRFTFAKLFKDGVPVGGRLLIHRGDLFHAASPATREPSTGSEKHMIEAHTWVDDCVRYHPLCHEATPRQPEYPARLLLIVPNSDMPCGPPKIRLESFDESKPRAKYLALSHCWGGATPFKLKHTNLQECSMNIDYHKLSKNIQDAIKVVQNLGFSYLWVDSLCIIQGCYHDWKREGSKMGYIYAGAFATIASTGAATSDGGCFHERTISTLQPCKVGISSLSALLPDPVFIRRDDISDFRRSVDRAPLNQRGWVLQERLLSHRILHFGADMMYWECAQRAASELNPVGYVYKRYPDELYGNFIPAPTPVDIVEPTNESGKWTRTADPQTPSSP
ncbi:heterokaryon incompatibility protein-domain-containing protein [Nemania sp. FL0031]|nr:heterokaryon incompatibility protein-domain-containing protein [Nemania sp. FL0031]